MIKESKLGKTHFEAKVKSLRNKATITINGNKMKVKANVISFHQNEKEELIAEMEKLLSSFYAKKKKKIGQEV